MSDLQRDIAEVDFLVAEFAGIEITAAWQRLRARLAEQSSAVASVASSPDLERVADAIEAVFSDEAVPDGRPFALAAADAAIKAMEGEP